MSDSTDQPISMNADQAASCSVDPNTGGSSAAVFGFRPQDRRVMTVLLFGLLLWLAVEWIVVATRRPDPLLLQRGLEFQASFRVHINESIWVDWMQLEGIGPSLAQRIIAERNIHGPFSSIEDVGRVPGIGPATLDRIRPWLTMDHDANKFRSADDASQRPPEQYPAKVKRQPSTL